MLFTYLKQISTKLCANYYNIFWHTECSDIEWVEDGNKDID